MKMGCNTTVVVMNDALSYIADDPLFGNRLADAIGQACSGKKVDVAAISKNGGVHSNAATVIECHHADFDVMVKVGGNTGFVIKGE